MYLTIYSSRHVYATTQDITIVNLAQEIYVFKAFNDNKLLYPVPTTVETEQPLQDFPWIKPGDFLQTMAKQHDLSHILGGFGSMAEAESMLVTFWTRYQQVFPNFEVFNFINSGQRSMQQCVPLYLHGDEGVTFKKRGVLFLSFQSPMGFGTSKRAQELSLNLQNIGESGLPLNFLKCGMYTRMLMVCCKKDIEVYKHWFVGACF